MTTRAFGPQTPRDLLASAEHEVNKLAAAIGSDFGSEIEASHEVGSLARACAGTLWNIVDWLAGSTDPATRSALAGAGLKTKKQIRKHVKAASGELTLCWELTNSIKHFELDGYALQSSQISEAMLSVPASRPPGVPAPQPPSVPAHGLPPAHRVVPKVKTDVGVNLPVLDVYRGALGYWQEFFNRLGV